MTCSRKIPTIYPSLVLEQLNSELMSITTLYSNFAEPYGLWECQLAILHCAGHPDSMLIATVWDEIISREISRTAEMAPHDRIRAMSIKIKSLGKLYSNSQKYFPLGKSNHMRFYSTLRSVREGWFGW